MSSNKICFVSPMASKSQQLHIILIPFLSQSHIIPILDFAKLLSQRDHLIITIVTTPVNSISIHSVLDHATISSHAKIRVITAPFPSIQVGLPQDCENMDTLPSPHMFKQLFAGCEMLQQPILKLLSDIQPRPSAIVSSNAIPWTCKVACSLGIPRYAFQTICCFSMLISHNVGRMNVSQSVMSDTEYFEVQNMPDKIVITKSQMPKAGLQRGEDIRKIVEQMGEAERLTRGMLVNSFQEMEPKYVEAFKNMGKKIWCIGPVSLCNQDSSDILERGGKKGSIDENKCLKWLDSMAPRSVIYACFGSIGRIPSAQIIETGLGLEASNRTFIWIIRKKDVSNQVEKWLDDEKFEERVKGRGLIIRGWAPQVAILSHPSVGGFITHCGWNSTLEAICAGVPMITWPMFAEQFYNEKLVVNVLKIGVRVGVEIVMKMELEDENKVFVSRVQVKDAIEQLMDDQGRMTRAKELSKLATKATNDGGSSFLNITALIQDIMEQTILK